MKNTPLDRAKGVRKWQENRREKLLAEGPKKPREKKEKKRKKARYSDGRPSQSFLRNKADDLCREYCKATCFTCEAEGAIVNGFLIPSGGRLEWAHLKSRNHKTIRHDPLNWMALSHRAHDFFTCHPDLWTRFIDEKYPGRWQRLNDLLIEAKQTRAKPDYPYWIDYYTRQLKALKDAA